MSYQKKDWRGPACQSFFWYDNDKVLETCFCVMQLKASRLSESHVAHEISSPLNHIKISKLCSYERKNCEKRDERKSMLKPDKLRHVPQKHVFNDLCHCHTKRACQSFFRYYIDQPAVNRLHIGDKLDKYL